jgi:hypothetical protein
MCAIFRRLAGFSTSSVSPAALSTQAPAISIRAARSGVVSGRVCSVVDMAFVSRVANW